MVLRPNAAAADGCGSRCIGGDVSKAATSLRHERQSFNQTFRKQTLLLDGSLECSFSSKKDQKNVSTSACLP